MTWRWWHWAIYALGLVMLAAIVGAGTATILAWIFG